MSSNDINVLTTDEKPADITEQERINVNNIPPKSIGAREIDPNVLIPIGGIILTGDINVGITPVPQGWLVCNGQAVSRITYNRLFAVISTVFGQGDGVSTFNVPNYSTFNPSGYLIKF